MHHELKVVVDGAVLFTIGWDSDHPDLERLVPVSSELPSMWAGRGTQVKPTAKEPPSAPAPVVAKSETRRIRKLTAMEAKVGKSYFMTDGRGLTIRDHRPAHQQAGAVNKGSRKRKPNLQVPWSTVLFTHPPTKKDLDYFQIPVSDRR